MKRSDRYLRLLRETATRDPTEAEIDLLDNLWYGLNLGDQASVVRYIASHRRLDLGHHLGIRGRNIG